MNMLESAAPLPLLRELKFWQSAPVQIPGQEEDTLMIPAITTDKVASEIENGADAAKTAKAKGKQKSKKPPASDMALLLAMQQMQRALPSIVGQGSARSTSVKSKEAE